MFLVTLPSGKTYTFGPAKYAAAVALANKTGGTVTRNTDDGYDARRDARREAGKPSGYYSRKYGKGVRMCY